MDPASFRRSAESGRLIFQDMDRTVSGAGCQRWASSVQFAAKFRAARLSGRKNREINDDATVSGMRVKVRLEVFGQPERDAAVAGADAPGGCHARALQDARIDRAVVSLEVQ